jgi:hypothetical protein
VLLAGLLAVAGVVAPSPLAPAAAAAVPANPKIVLVVGATESTTSSYRTAMDAVYATAAKYSTNVVKVYSPNATWAAVKAALQGASIVVYMGHGNGFPSPYRSSPWPYTQNGFGLNAVAGQGDNNRVYYGESYIGSEVRLAPNAVVILSHLCYASGNSESGLAEPTIDVAEARIDNYAAGFARAGASTVIADGHNEPSYYLDALFTTHQTMEQLWRAYPRSAGHVFSFDSSRTPGDTAFADPDGFSGVTGLSGAFSSHVARTFGVTGKGGVPANAVAVTGNLTVTAQTASGYVYLGPGATNNPTSSTLNFPLRDDRANGVTVALGAGGTLSATYVAATLGPTTQVIFDVTGYFVPDTSGATYHALTPARILDSRSGVYTRFYRSLVVKPGATTDGVTGAALSTSVVADTVSATYHALTPARILDSGGVYASFYRSPVVKPGATTDDVTTSGATYVPLTPVRLLDTRSANGLSGAFSSHVARTFGVTTRGGVPANAVAVTGNLTVTAQTASGYVYLGPGATNNPTSSTLNFPLRDDRANGVTVALGAGGTLSATYVAATLGPTTQVIFDVTGYFQ